MTEALPARCDLVIEGGTVIDGTGAPGRPADVAVAGERIAAVGALAGWQAQERIDAAGLAVAPGFIDAHTHDDRLALECPDMTPKLSQGVTTVVAGNCGVSLAPSAWGRDPPPPLDLLGGRDWYRFASVAEYRAAFESAPPALNLALLAGHATLRIGAMAELDRPASGREIDRMLAALDEALAAGCIGLSTGLYYPPARSAPTEEIVALAERVAAHGGIYATHMRDEADQLLEAVEESLEIGRRAGLPLVISHHKACGRANWGKTRETLALIATARERQRVDLDVYPYVASSTVLLAQSVAQAERVTISWSKARPEAAGRDLDEIAAEWDCSLDEAVERLQPAGAIYYQMDEADLRRVLAFEDSMIGSDGLPHDLKPHPRLWGSFPRVLGHYARDEGLFPLEQAVRKMTSVPARVLGFADRGVVRAGAFADLVLFDPATVIDRARFGDPLHAAQGIALVLVAGRTVWDGAAWTGARPGRMLERQAVA